MGLLDFFKRSSATPAEPAPAPDAVTAARTRARRRLIGATVLLGIGIVGFPLLFETQPRPIAVDIPIELPRKDGLPPLSLPPPMASAPGAVATDATPDAAPRQGHADNATPPPVPAAREAAEVTERADEQGRERLSPAAAAAALAAPAAVAVAQPSPVPGKAGASKPATTTAKAVPAASKPAVPDVKPVKPGAAEAARARALLDGGTPGAAPAASAASARVVVQVGAYTDPEKLREARRKVEKLGFKSYTQVVQADGGSRTRVRVGPFASKAEADKAAGKLKGAGLPAAILTL